MPPFIHTAPLLRAHLHRPAAAQHDRSQRARGPRLSCVIPCRNEARNLVLLLPLLREMLDAQLGEWEVIVVDDGSSDDTAIVMREWTEVPGMRLVQLSRNFGKEAALTAGLEEAQGDIVVMMDADMQHPVALIPEMLARWREGADVVYAYRSSRADESLVKRSGARLFYALLNRFHRFRIPEDAGDFRLLDRIAVDALLALPERNRFMKGLYAWIGFDAVGVPYLPPPRAHGRSQFGGLRLLGLSLDGLTAFTTWPLRIVSAVGTAVATASFAYGAYLTGVYLLYGHEVSGWTTIVVALMFFSGIQMIFAGILGEYIARIFEEVKRRPLYLVKRHMGRGLTERQR
jgi:glycosyltransferase involved in cell wall biosynthesis